MTIGFILVGLLVFVIVDVLCYAYADWPSSFDMMESLSKKSGWIPGAGIIAVFRYGLR